MSNVRCLPFDVRCPILFLFPWGGGGGGGERKEMEWPILFYIRFSYKHCNFSHVCLLVKMASKTVTRSIGLKGCGVYFSAKFSWTSPLSDQVRPLLSPRSKGKETVSKNVLHTCRVFVKPTAFAMLSLSSPSFRLSSNLVPRFSLLPDG